MVVTRDGEIGARLGPVVTIRDGRVDAEGRGGRDLAVAAGDGTAEAPPTVPDRYPTAALFDVFEEPENRVVFSAGSSEPTPRAG